VTLADDVDLERIAASIPGSTGADIALLVNEARALCRPPRTLQSGAA